MDIQNGIYPGKPVQFTPYETESGALCIAILFEFTDQAPPPYVGTRLKHVATIIKSDGTVMEKGVARLRDIYGWTGADPYWFQDNMETVGDIVADLTVENEPYTNPTTGKETISPKIKWVNKQGEGGSGASMPTPSERSTIASKYGAKLRAVAGAGPSKPPGVARPAAAPVAKPAMPAAPQSSLPGIPAPAPKAPVPSKSVKSTMEEVYAALCKENDGLSETDMHAKWFATLAEKYPNTDQSSLTPEQWGKLLLFVTDNVPF